MSPPLSIRAELMKCLRPERGWMVFAVLLGTAAVSGVIGLMMTSAYLISRAAFVPSIADVRVPVAGVRFFGIARAVFRYFERIVSHDATFRILARLRIRLFEIIEPRSPALLWRSHSGDLLTRVVADVETLEHIFSRLLAPAAIALAVVIPVLLLFLYVAPACAAGLAAGLAAGGILLPWIGRRIGRRIGTRLVTVRAEMQERLVDFSQGLPDLLVFNRAGAAREKLDALSAEWTRLQQRMSLLAGCQDQALGFMATLSSGVVLWFGSRAVVEGQMSGTLLAALTLGAMACFEIVASLPVAFQHWDHSREAARRVFGLAQDPPEITAPPQPDPSPTRVEVRLEGVTFRYEPGAAEVLSDCSLQIEEGRRVALVGPSGAGKSTLAQLLLRFHDPSRGQILLGGTDLRRLDPATLPDLVCVVAQDAWLFNGTIRENLLLARSHATDGELWKALEQSGAAGFVREFPQELHTPVGEQGRQLSGGQRRRIALAQALLRGAPILVLDEPTADLDPETEREVMAKIWTLEGPRILMVITHRLHQLNAADEVLVLDQGRVVQRGTARQLAQSPGLFADLAVLQREADALE